VSAIPLRRGCATAPAGSVAAAAMSTAIAIVAALFPVIDLTFTPNLGDEAESSLFPFPPSCPAAGRLPDRQPLSLS
jgi:hypothetical protein